MNDYLTIPKRCFLQGFRKQYFHIIFLSLLHQLCFQVLFNETSGRPIWVFLMADADIIRNVIIGITEIIETKKTFILYNIYAIFS